MIIILYPECVLLTIYQEGGPHLLLTQLVLQQVCLSSPLITEPQCCSSSHVPSLMG